MEDTHHGWSLEELVERSGLSARTIRYYIAERLLPGPQARGKAASYGEEHLLRLRLIRSLTEQHQPLVEIGRRLADLSLDELRALVAEEGERQATLRQKAEARSPREYIAALLERAQQARPGSPPSTPIAARESAIVSGQAPGAAGRHRAWQRWELAPGVELHVRDDVRSAQRPLVERILHVAQDLELSEHERALGPAQRRARRKEQQ